MKVIDEKGKLFGKLNIIDLLVIILILAAIVVVGIKFLAPSQAPETPENSTPAAVEADLTYTVRVTAQSARMAEEVGKYVDAAAGKRDQLMAGNDMADAYVVDFWTEPTSYNRLSTGAIEVFDAAELEASGADLVDICFVIEAHVEDALTNVVGTQQVRLGKNHVVKTCYMEFTSGVVESCIWEEA